MLPVDDLQFWIVTLLSVACLVIVCRRAWTVLRRWFGLGAAGGHDGRRHAAANGTDGQVGPRTAGAMSDGPACSSCPSTAAARREARAAARRAAAAAASATSDPLVSTSTARRTPTSQAAASGGPGSGSPPPAGNPSGRPGRDHSVALTLDRKGLRDG